MAVTTQLNTGTTPLIVSEGGTGVATNTTAYAPLAAGTTATGALQVCSTGLATSGFVLTSTGSSSLPSFQAVAVPAGTTSGVAKFWINAAGAGTSTNASFNVTSITDTGTGTLTVTIATDFSTTNWAGNANGKVAGGTLTSFVFSAQTAGACTVICFQGSLGNLADPQLYYVSGFGDQ